VRALRSKLQPIFCFNRILPQVLERIFEPLLLPSPPPNPSDSDSESESEQHFPLSLSSSIASKIRTAAADALLSIGGCKHVLQTTREKSYALYRQFKSAGFGGSGSVVDVPSLFALLPVPPFPADAQGTSSKKPKSRSDDPSLLPSSGVRKRHDPKNQLIAKSKKKATAELTKMRASSFSGGADGVLSPRAAAKLLKLKMMRSRLVFGIRVLGF
jgi:hypothetical protein